MRAARTSKACATPTTRACCARSCARKASSPPRSKKKPPRARARAREIDFAQYFQRVSVQDVAITTRQLATLLRAGVPLVESLSALIDQVDQPQAHARR